MVDNKRNIYQFKITLAGVKPKIWRRIQVPDFYSFWDLHVAIQDAMGWSDCHLHQFIVPSKYSKEDIFIGVPDKEFMDDDEILLGKNIKISRFISKNNPRAAYEYDFGDGWSHLLELEKILPAEDKVNYPICIGGSRACPLEDCGGVGGYEHLVKVLNDPKHKEYDEIVEWVGGDFDPENFIPKKIKFDNPQERYEDTLH